MGHEIGPNGKADGGPASRPCGVCKQTGRYQLGATRTAICHTPTCEVIAYLAPCHWPPTPTGRE